MNTLQATTQDHNPIDCLSVTPELAGNDALMGSLAQLHDNGLLTEAINIEAHFDDRWNHMSYLSAW